jgi:hypothetical protein
VEDFAALRAIAREVGVVQPDVAETLALGPERSSCGELCCAPGHGKRGTENTRCVSGRSRALAETGGAVVVVLDVVLPRSLLWAGFLSRGSFVGLAAHEGHETDRSWATALQSSALRNEICGSRRPDDEE